MSIAKTAPARPHSAAGDGPGYRDDPAGPDPAVAGKRPVGGGGPHRLAEPAVAQQHVHSRHHGHADRDDHYLHGCQDQAASPECAALAHGVGDVDAADHGLDAELDDEGHPERDDHQRDRRRPAPLERRVDGQIQQHRQDRAGSHRGCQPDPDRDAGLVDPVRDESPCRHDRRERQVEHVGDSELQREAHRRDGQDCRGDQPETDGGEKQAHRCITPARSGLPAEGSPEPRANMTGRGSSGYCAELSCGDIARHLHRAGGAVGVDLEDAR